MSDEYPCSEEDRARFPHTLTVRMPHGDRVCRVRADFGRLGPADAATLFRTVGAHPFGINYGPDPLGWAPGEDRALYAPLLAIGSASTGSAATPAGT